MRNDTPAARWFGALLALLWSVCGLAEELVILNWADYMDPELIAEFEQESGADIRFVYYESDEGRDNYLVEQGIEGVDLAVVDNTAVKPYAKRGWLLPVSGQTVPNLHHIDPKWAQYYRGLSDYAVPYGWGTLGIVYRRDRVAQPPTSWLDLLRPAPALHGRIRMIDDSVELVAVALKALGYSMNETGAEALDRAEALLREQRPAVQDYGYFAIDEDSDLIAGDLAMAMAYNGDALMLAGLDERIGFVVPEEGGSLWVDYLAVLSKSRHPELAWRFVDFMNRPANAARNAQYLYTATANQAAEQELPEEFLADPLVYPPPAVLARCEPYAELPPAVRRRLNSIFANVAH